MHPGAGGQHEHRGVPAVQRLVEYAPSSGGLALWVAHRDVDDDDPALPARRPAPLVTDGRTLLYRPAFERLPLPEQAGWVAHAVLHVALRHAQRHAALRTRLGDVDLRLYNLCANAIVDSALDHLGWLVPPKDSVRLETVLADVLGIVTTAEEALLAWDVERLYLAVDDRAPPRGRRGGERGQRGGQGQAEEDDSRRTDGQRSAVLRALGQQAPVDLQPSPDEGQRPEREAEDAREWAERLLRAHTGDGAFSLLRVLLADRPQPRTPWERALRTQLARALSRQPAPSWSRPARSWIANQGRMGSRRMPWEPGLTASRAVPRLSLVVDVSGSIDDGLVQRFAREVEAIVRRLEAAMTIVVGDDAVRRVVAYEPGRTDLAALRVQGAGNTDFAPLIAEALRHGPDLVVVLTDLDGPAGERPRCPVLWAVTEAHAAAEAPFGRKLVLR